MKKIIFEVQRILASALSRTRFNKMPFVTLLHRSIYEFSKPKGVVRVNCQGHKIHINGSDTGISPSILSKRTYEPFVTQLLDGLLAKDMTFVNIGANIGYFTLVAAKKIGSNGKVYAFEPEPQNYELLVRNIRANGYRNVTAIRAAVADKKGVRKLFLDVSNQGNPSLGCKNTAVFKGSVEVRTDSLDNFLKEYGSPVVDIIQVDAQGSEGLIFDGAQRTLQSPRLKIIMEFWPYGLGNMGTDALGLLERIKGLGFKIGLIDENEKRIIYLTNQEIFGWCVGKKSGLGHCNLLLEKQ